MRTCAEKLALQLARRRERVIASGRVPRINKARHVADDDAGTGTTVGGAAAGGHGGEEASMQTEEHRAYHPPLGRQAARAVPRVPAEAEATPDAAAAALAALCDGLATAAGTLRQAGS